MELEKLLDFLLNCDARITHGDSWLVTDVDSDGEKYYTVYSKSRYARKTKRLYEGHSLADALWCLEYEEEYK